MLIEGGVPLLLGYLALAVAVAVVLVRTLWHGSLDPLVPGVGGSLVAFHVQSLVSIDNYTRQAGLLQQVGMNEPALDVATLGAQADPGSASLRAFAGLLAQQLGRQEEATEWFERALALDPFNPVILRAAAEQWVLAGDPDGAAALYQRMLAVQDTAPDVWDALAGAAEAAGDTDTPTAAQERAATLRAEPAAESS